MSADATGRTPTDYAIEHAEYMAKDAERLLDALSEHAAAHIALAEGDYDSQDDIKPLNDRCEKADESLAEHMAHMRDGIYGFRTRRDRALATPTPPQPEHCPHCDGTGDVHSIDGEWRGRCTCEAGAPAPAEAVALDAKDAARYRWLRDTNLDDKLRATDEHHDPMQVSMIWFGHPADQWHLGSFASAFKGEKFDQALDAAINAADQKETS
jgi:hypothetical protein